ncbi:Tetratricopeptide repeat-containing protein [Parelusimicrobium proximum]|uniref:tetratricopeptide repeat protein n=1 Tax=Parelusimicrobium proximum TaxID=3228953 RepID=UPI003D17E844
MKKQTTHSTHHSDYIITPLDKAAKFCKTNSVMIVIIAVVLIAAVIGSFVYCNSVAAKHEAAWTQFYLFQNAKDNDSRKLILDQINEQFSGEAAAFYANYTYADYLFTQGNYADASAVLEKIYQYKNKEAAPIAHAALTTNKLSEKKYSEVVSLGQDFIASYPGHYALAQVYINVGFAQQALQNYPAAINNFRQLTENYPNTYFATLGQNKLKELDKYIGKEEAK